MHKTALAQRLRALWGAGEHRWLWRALLISLALHGVLLLVRFVPEDAFKQFDTQGLKIILLNQDGASSPPPDVAQALAQRSNLGGGEADSGLIASPNGAAVNAQAGDATAELQRQVQSLEQQQAALLNALKLTTDKTQIALGANKVPNPTAGSAAKSAEQTAALSQLAALEKQVNDYNARPKRKQISPATREAFFAGYYAAWRERVELLGTAQYPQNIAGLAGDVIVTVSLKPNGVVDDVLITRSSGDKRIDRAAVHLVKKLGPYQPFDKAVRERLDLLDITTRITFSPAQTVSAETVGGALQGIKK